MSGEKFTLTLLIGFLAYYYKVSLIRLYFTQRLLQIIGYNKFFK